MNSQFVATFHVDGVIKTNNGPSKTRLKTIYCVQECAVVMEFISRNPYSKREEFENQKFPTTEDFTQPPYKDHSNI